MNQKQYATIPTAILPELEAWGEMTAKLFGQLRHQAGLRPIVISEDQRWYWSIQWQAWERDADSDIASGHISTFSNVEDLIESLDS